VCRKVRTVEHGLPQILLGSAAALFNGLPFQVGFFSNAALSREVGFAIREGDYDIVYNYYLRTAPAVPAIFSPNRTTAMAHGSAAAFLALQLSQTLNTRRIYENERGWLKRLFYRVEFARLRSYEARIWRNFTKTVLIGARDVEDIRDACRHGRQPEIDNWTLSAHGTDVEQFRPARDDEVVPGRIVFSGSMRYQPNVQAALWFVEHCWNTVRDTVAGAELYIVGQSPTTALRALDGQNGIYVTGTVPDISEHIRRATVCINPMRAAGGMQNKLIEYMASGKAVVATSIANEGICAPTNTLALADEPGDFSATTISLLANPHEAMRLGRAARDYVVREWTWERQFEKLEATFYSALTPGLNEHATLARK
jgi:glycosyltransferase involved in cell wall biosynthesis